MHYSGLQCQILIEKKRACLVQVVFLCSCCEGIITQLSKTNITNSTCKAGINTDVFLLPFVAFQHHLQHYFLTTMPILFSFSTKFAKQ